MTEYKNRPQKLKKDKRREKFLEQKKINSVNESEKMISKDLESDSLAKIYDKFSKTYRPSIKIKSPEQFAHFGSAQQYYLGAASNIINYYPFDGTREEVLEWHRSGSVVDLSLYKQLWPSAVGHFNANYSQYINFYAGPNKIPEAEFVGKSTHKETGLRIDPTKGNTVEFWMKKDSFNTASNPVETIFDVGSYPGKLSSSNSAQIKLALSASTGSPFRLTYKVSSSGSVNVQIGSANLTNSSVADAKWHHYALKFWHSGTNLNVKMYVDGNVDSTHAISAGSMTAVDSYLGGTIAAAHGSASGDFSGSIDDFRFWKGPRTSRQITRYFDKKIYASDQRDPKYDNMLGLNYRFNKSPVNRTSVDSLVMDHSGNDVIGRINNYTDSCRVPLSAITLSEQSQNTEPGDPILDYAHTEVSSLTQELKLLGETHDNQNQSMLQRFIPDWARQEMDASQSITEFEILLHLMSNEFDEIKIFLDSSREDLIPNYQETNQIITNEEVNKTGSINYSNNIFIGCVDSDIDNTITNGYRAGKSQQAAWNLGLRHDLFFQKSDNITDAVEGITENLRQTETMSEVRNAFAQRCAVEANNLMKRKGTYSSIRSIYSISGIDTTDLTDMFLRPSAEIYLKEDKSDHHISRINSVNFLNNSAATLYMSSALSDETTYIPHCSGTTNAQYTFEGSYIFPALDTSELEIIKCPLYGLREVSGSKNDLTVTAPDRANLTVFVEKKSLNSDKARFVLESNSSIISTSLNSPYMNKVYDNSRWNIGVRVRKATSEPFIDLANESYELVFSGYNYLLEDLINSFQITSPITKEKYEKFNESNKTVFLGANRTNITGSVIDKTDVSILNFSAWEDSLLDEEIIHRARNPLSFGSSRPHYKNFSSDRRDRRSAVFKTQFSALSVPIVSGIFEVEDETSGSLDRVSSQGPVAGQKYNFKSIGFSTDLAKVVREEHVSHVRTVPMASFKGVDEIQIKDSAHEKLNLSSKSTARIFSFEKSVYQAVSRDIYNFLAGIKAYNNVIGEPVNKYRKEYKLLNHLREKYFSNVLNDLDFERYMSYYRWMDSAIGVLLEQMIPASSFSNVGIENVVESHALERNKYDHKYNRLEQKPPSPGTNLLAINEMLYDWKHGHGTPATQAAATFTFGDTEFDDVNSASITLIDSLGASKTYVIRNDYGASGALEFNAGANVAAAAENFIILVNSANGHNGTIEATRSGATITLKQKNAGIAGNTSIAVSNWDSITDINAPSSFTGGSGNDEDMNCFWQRDRKLRTGDRETIRNVLTTVVTGSGWALARNYVMRNLVRPYKYTADRQDTLSLGHNRKANKIRSLYEIIKTGKNISIKSDDIYEFKKCDDIIDAQNEKIYVAKTNTSDVDNYLDADADLILPFTFYSSSAGYDFSNFKHNLKITNNLDMPTSLQGLLPRDMMGGMPHRNVKVGVTSSADRPEAYSIVSTAASLTITQASGSKSMFHKGAPGSRLYHIGNVKTRTSPLVLGNYSKDYEIVMTNGRSSNNTYLVESEGVGLTGSLGVSSYISGVVNFEAPVRTRREHVIVNRFSSPGTPESSGLYGLDREAAEYSVYSTVNYRNSLVRDTYNILSTERSERFGYRSGSNTQQSIHKTNRNLLKLTGIGHASASFTFGDTEFDDVNNASITLVNTAGLSRTYVIKNDYGASSALEFNAGANANVAAENFILLVNGSNGHNGTITASRDGAAITLIQAAGGRKGNTEIAVSNWSSITDVNSPASFAGGDIPVDTSDNLFIQHQIPHHDFSYSWIAASADEDVYSFLDKNGNISHQHTFDISGSLKSSETIQFLSASKLGSAYGVLDLPYYPSIEGDAPAFIPVDFTGLNTHIYEPTDSENNLLGHSAGISIGRPGYSAVTRTRPLVSEYYFNNNFLKGISTSHGRTDGDVTGLNSLILNRQGPYGWPSWKQIRGSEHKITRSHRKNNTLSIVMRNKFPFSSCYAGLEFDYSRTKEDNNTKEHPRKVSNYKEIMATCKFNPITVSMHTYNTESGIELLRDAPIPRTISQLALSRLWFNDEFLHEFLTKTQNRPFSVTIPSLSLRAPVQNVVTGFANQEMADDIRFKEAPFLSCVNIGIINDFIRDNGNRPGASYLEANYIETIYPREINTFTKHSRDRSLYDFFGWKSSRTQRELILTGNVKYSGFITSDTQRRYFLPSEAIKKENSFRNSYYDSYEHIDLNTTGATASPLLSSFVTSSRWVLDSRADFSERPVNITSSFFTRGDIFLGLRDQATRGEGVLQNDYSIFPLGFNGLKGTPPYAPIYNRRVPQASGSDVYLAGEAVWEATGSSTIGPFYDKYSDFAEEVRLVGQEYSLLPEFKISSYIEDIFASGNFSNPEIGDGFLELTGAVYHTSSGELSIGKQFFKTYSNSDFMKYFQPFSDNLKENGLDMNTGKLTLRCSAVKRLLPYRGFYPAERSVQITEIFNRNYLPESSYDLGYIQNASLSEQQSKDSIRIKIENSKGQVSKPLFAPGVLFNSIKSGLAVDYPIFSSSVHGAISHLSEGEYAVGTINFSSYSNTISDDETFNGGSVVFYTNASKNSGILYSFSNNASDGATGHIVSSTPNPIVRVQVDGLTTLRSIVYQLELAMASIGGHNGSLTGSYNSTTKTLSLTRTSAGPSEEIISGSGTPFTLDRVSYTGWTGGSALDRGPVTDFSDFELDASTCYTGSIVNNTVDSGIPRLTGSVERRVDFNDLLQPERLFSQVIYENEPHPSSSILYGDRMFMRAVEHDPKFGLLNSSNARLYNSAEFSANWARFVTDLRPYRSAINNFAAETVKFFLKDQKLQTAVSAPAKPLLTKDVAYKMRVYVNNKSVSMYDRHSAFGPAVDEGAPEFTAYVLNSTPIPGTYATGSIDFRANTSSAAGNTNTWSITASCNYDENLQPLSVDSAYDSYTPYDNEYFHVSGATHGAAIYYYDSRCFTGSYVKLVFKDPSAYDSSTISKMAVSASNVLNTVHGFIPNAATDGTHFSIGTPSLSYWSTVSSSNTIQLPFGVYDSNISDPAATHHMIHHAWRVSGSDAVQHGSTATAVGLAKGLPFIDIRTSGSGTTYKTAAQMAYSVECMLASGSWFVPGPGGNRVEVFRNGATISIFSKVNTQKYPTEFIHFFTASHYNWYGNNVNNLYTDSFSAIGSSDTNIAHVTAHSPADGHLGAVSFPIKFNASGHTIEQVVSTLESQSDAAVSGGTSETYNRYIDLSASTYTYNSSTGNHTGTNLACLTKNEIINLSSSHNELSLSASCTKDTAAEKSVISIYRLDTGSDGNYTMIPSGFASNNWVNEMIGLAGGTNIQLPDEPYLEKQTTTEYASHGYLPFVPPFLDPNTAPHAEITFTPSETKNYTIPEIIDGMAVTYNNMPAPSNSSLNSNYKEAMVLSASLDFDKSVLLYPDNHFYQGPPGEEVLVPAESRDFYRWVINPKWETPVFDFQKTEQSALNLVNDQVVKVSQSPWKNRYQTSYYETGAVSATPYLTSSTGMWHQSGTLLENSNKGYYLTIVGAQVKDNAFGNLASEVGFLDQIDSPSLTFGVPKAQPFKEIKLGQVAKSKVISEAVIAIPYYLSDDCDMKLFPLKEGLRNSAWDLNLRAREEFVHALRTANSPREIKNIKDEYEKFHESVGLESIDNAAYQLRMMDKYILPPQFDFTRNENIDPHVAYIFQFKAELSSEDLSDIWQNTYPKRGEGISIAQHSKPTYHDAETDVEYITHILSAGDSPWLRGKDSVFNSPEEFLEKNVRWLVFKIKYRAESHYSNIINDSLSEVPEDVMAAAGTRKFGTKATSTFDDIDEDEKRLFSNYSYNWPYDYFSIIEMIKLESKVDFFSSAPGSPAATSPDLTIIQDTPDLISSETTADMLTKAASLTTLDNIVTRQQIKSDVDSLPSSPNEFNITLPTGYSLKSDTEAIYVNGILQVAGTNDDYNMSGNKIVFTYDLQPDDKIHVSYIKE